MEILLAFIIGMIAGVAISTYLVGRRLKKSAGNINPPPVSDKVAQDNDKIEVWAIPNKLDDESDGWKRNK